ncbi:class A beta-lactamase [Acidovorax sp. SUPP2539]|uniref:class A beta-lactamase n=1 Tax=Acidovorax sp. SUPP2539 TaxID=2920878 RepID=UPI0023DE3AFC|nr:class A beta-lactamase [Acidovorax sp. SUPP2539]GKS91371.1 class A beta-lactamase [Acidovorax sp. SUPP2539]
MQRRQFSFDLFAAVAAASTAALWAGPAHAAAPAGQRNGREVAWQAAMQRLESALDGHPKARLGVAMLDTGSGLSLGWRQDERFPMASTFKLLLAAWMLERVDRGQEALDRRVHFDASALVAYSPVTEKRVGDVGITVGELCEGTVTLSDNTAANLLLARHGGPQGFTAFARSLGDTVTRLDRTEPTLNEAIAGDPRDTTTPQAMLQSLRKVALGDALSPASRAQLVEWIVATKTGDKRLRAGVPGWRVGDKTGTGNQGSSNDIGVLWPPGGGAPIVVTCYITQTTATPEKRDATIAEVARQVARAVAA